MAHAGRGLRWLHDDRPNAERLLRRVHNSCPLLRARIDRRPWPAMRMHVSTITATLGRAPIELIDHVMCVHRSATTEPAGRFCTAGRALHAALMPFKFQPKTEQRRPSKTSWIMSLPLCLSPPLINLLYLAGCHRARIRSGISHV